MPPSTLPPTHRQRHPRSKCYQSQTHRHLSLSPRSLPHSTLVTCDFHTSLHLLSSCDCATSPVSSRSFSLRICRSDLRVSSLPGTESSTWASREVLGRQTLQTCRIPPGDDGICRDLHYTRDSENTQNVQNQLQEVKRDTCLCSIAASPLRGAATRLILSDVQFSPRLLQPAPRQRSVTYTLHFPQGN